MEKVKGDGYLVTYDDATNTVTFKGSLRLRGREEYVSIVELLDRVAYAGSEAITLDLRELRFLNSAGIDILFRFAIKVREQAMEFVVLGDSTIPWQAKSLPHLVRLVPGLQLEME